MKKKKEIQNILKFLGWFLFGLKAHRVNSTGKQNHSVSYSQFCLFSSSSGRMLGIADYAVLAATLLISAAIGLYYRFTGGRQG